jgi:high-affinity iron transporter
MFANYLIGLREGLEAALIVTILLTYLYKTDRKSAVRYVWIGVIAAASLSAAVAGFFTLSPYYLTFKQKEILGGTLSIITVSLVTWMIFWLATHARGLKNELHKSIDTALSISPISLILFSFLAVGREGIETGLFVWSAILSTGSSSTPIIGAILGITSASLMGYFLFKGTLHLNLSRFFFYTGVGLIVIAAGVLAYGIHDLQESGIIPGLNDVAFDISGTVDMNSWYGALLKGTINFNATPSVVELITWTTYLAATLSIYIKKSRFIKTKTIELRNMAAK